MPQKKNKIKDENDSKIFIDNLKNKINKKEIQLKKFKQETKKDKDKLLRNIADLQNLIKRNQKHSVIEINRVKKKYLIQIIDILDIIKKSYKDKDPKTGIKLIINDIEKFLQDENIKYIDCIGKSFDHKIHHAITMIEKNNCDDEIIIDELKKGYYINGNILRPSQVIVAKKINK